MWIYEQPNWPNFTWDKNLINSKLKILCELQNKLQLQKESIHDLRKIDQHELSVELNFLTNSVVKSSNIEGVYPKEKTVREIIAQRMASQSTKSVRKCEWDGIINLILDVNWNCTEPLTKERMWKWHKGMFPAGFSGMTRIDSGKWRKPRPGKHRMMVVTPGKLPYDPPKTIHYIAPEDEQVAAEMDRFIAWFEADDDNLNLLLKSGIAHLWFELIHPFDDGNGRIGRALSDMLLARANNSNEPFHNLSSRIKTEVADYYSQLEKQARNSLDITDWLAWFLDCLGRSIEDAKQIVENTGEKLKVLTLVHKIGVNERQLKVIHRMLQDDFQGYMNNSKYVKIGKCTNSTTAARDIGYLEEHGILLRNPGGGRSTSYRLVTWDDIKKKDRRNQLETKSGSRTKLPK